MCLSYNDPELLENIVKTAGDSCFIKRSLRDMLLLQLHCRLELS